MCPFNKTMDFLAMQCLLQSYLYQWSYITVMHHPILVTKYSVYDSNIAKRTILKLATQQEQYWRT